MDVKRPANIAILVGRVISIFIHAYGRCFDNLLAFNPKIRNRPNIFKKDPARRKAISEMFGNIVSVYLKDAANAVEPGINVSNLLTKYVFFVLDQLVYKEELFMGRVYEELYRPSKSSQHFISIIAKAPDPIETICKSKCCAPPIKLITSMASYLKFLYKGTNYGRAYIERIVRGLFVDLEEFFDYMFLERIDDVRQKFYNFLLETIVPPY